MSVMDTVFEHDPVRGYMEPYKYEFDNEHIEPENEYYCVCAGSHACDCVYDPELGRLVPRDLVFDVEQGEE